jgi:predicted metal-dependent phosphoesterase TrpH
MSLETIISRCNEIGINCIAIADHGTIAGALRMQEIAPFPVIVAEEVLTDIGEVMGFFLTEEVPSGTSVNEAIERIKAQGGLVGVPHPFDRMRGIGPQALKELLPSIDFIEAFNSRILPLSNSNEKARLFAQEHGLPCTAGSDAHTITEIGHAYVEIPEFNGKEEFKQVLAQGQVFGRRSSPFPHFASTLARLRSRNRE